MLYNMVSYFHILLSVFVYLNILKLHSQAVRKVKMESTSSALCKGIWISTHTLHNTYFYRCKTSV